MKKKLPKRFSTLLQWALDDFKANRKAGHEIDMGTWLKRGFDITKPKSCTMCFAGSTLFRSFGAKPDPALALPAAFYDHLDGVEDLDKRVIARSLNSLRLGDLCSAVRQFYARWDQSPSEFPEISDDMIWLGNKIGHSSNHREWTTFQRRIARLVVMLKENGL